MQKIWVFQLDERKNEKGKDEVTAECDILY